MSRIFIVKTISFATCLVAGLVLLLCNSNSEAAKTVPASQSKAVDVNMHDFMEGVFQAPYRRLKKTMEAEPQDNAGWKMLRSDALILSEGGNLLLLRLPEKDADAWIKFSVDSRDAGERMIKAAKQKDFATATTEYKLMLEHCNACHKQFEQGKHMLAP